MQRCTLGASLKCFNLALQLVFYCLFNAMLTVKCFISVCVDRGQKSLFYPDKEAVNMTSYMIAHPDDIPSLMLAHQQSKHSSVTVEGILIYHR